MAPGACRARGEAVTIPALIELAQAHVLRFGGACFLAGMAVTAFGLILASGPSRHE
jgi:hypothetical protein